MTEADQVVIELRGQVHQVLPSEENPEDDNAHEMGEIGEE